MTPEQMNYLTNLTNATDAVLIALSSFEDRVTEGFDRNIPAALPELDFAETSNLDHLTVAKLQNLFASYQALDTVLQDNDRQVIKDFLGVVRSWNR